MLVIILPNRNKGFELNLTLTDILHLVVLHSNIKHYSKYIHI